MEDQFSESAIDAIEENEEMLEELSDSDLRVADDAESLLDVLDER